MEVQSKVDGLWFFCFFGFVFCVLFGGRRVVPGFRVRPGLGPGKIFESLYLLE